MGGRGYYSANGHKNTENEDLLAKEAKLARECGMTYGQYKAKLEYEKMRKPIKTNEGTKG